MALTRKQDLQIDPELEMNNPQLTNPLAQNVPTVKVETIVENVVANDNMAVIEEHRNIDNDSNTETSNNVTSDMITPINNVGKLVDNKIVTISTTDFTKFVNNLSLLKSIQKTHVFNNGTSYFMSDNGTTVFEWNTHLDISLSMADIDTQISTFKLLLYGNPENIYLRNNNDISYTLSNGNRSKTDCRKPILDDKKKIDKDVFDNLAKIVEDNPDNSIHISTISFSDDAVSLDFFLHTINTITSNGLYIESDKNEKVLWIGCGDPNASVIRIIDTPYDNTAIKEVLANTNQPTAINTKFDTTYLKLPFVELVIDLYYRKERDDLFGVIKGKLDNGTDIHFINFLHRNTSNSTNFIYGD